MVTLTDRCSSRCNLVVLFHTRVLSAFWRTKNVFESHLIATAGSAGSAGSAKSLKLFSLMIYHFDVILDRIDQNYSK